MKSRAARLALLVMFVVALGVTAYLFRKGEADRRAETTAADAFSSIRYREHWYWIDDRDLRSKSLFTFLMFIFSLTETQGKEGAPIVTIPAG